MPQLSIETYITQYLWLVIVLGVFYYYISTQIVPKIGEIKKTRAHIAMTAATTTAATTTAPTNAAISPIQLGGIIINKGDVNKGGEAIFEKMNKEWTTK